ncbi:TPA: hypothetical protein VJE30_001359 [Streptococcus pyogenes]|nr:hypothetical protein [Streptococcus pyogenes]
MIFISMKRLVTLMLLFLAAIALFVFYKTYGLSLFFLLIVGLLALKFMPILVVPILLITIGVYFSGGFSFVGDTLVYGFLAIPFTIIVYPYVEAGLIFLDKKKNRK